jgi:hypothetical protein
MFCAPSAASSQCCCRQHTASLCQHEYDHNTPCLRCTAPAQPTMAHASLYVTTLVSFNPSVLIVCACMRSSTIRYRFPYKSIKSVHPFTRALFVALARLARVTSVFLMTQLLPAPTSHANSDISWSKMTELWDERQATRRRPTWCGYRVDWQLQTTRDASFTRKQDQAH